MPGYTVTVTPPEPPRVHVPAGGDPCEPCGAMPGEVHSQGCLHRPMGFTERHPVDTLEEARAYAHDRVVGHAPSGPLHFRDEALALGFDGGTIGPLPDGSTITVEADREDGER